MGWFFPQPVQPPQLGPAPPGAVAWTNIPPNPTGPTGLQLNAIRQTWPQEDWPAQRGATVASQLAPAWANPPQPQPFYQTRPLDAVILQTWPQEQWPSQVLIGGGGGALTASVFVQPVAIATRGASIRVAILQSWPQEDWAAQRGAQIASILATVVSPPAIFPSPPSVLQALVRAQWLPEDWRAQSEAGIASGLAQLQQPPIYIPRPFAPQMALLRSLWPDEQWPAQTGPKSAGWYPLPIVAIPRPIPHLEIQQWPQEQWSAQTGARIASLLAQPPKAQPFIDTPLLAGLRAAWPQEDWPAQRSPIIATFFATPPPNIGYPYTTVPQFPISQWLPESWPAQRGAVSPWLIPPPPPPPFNGVLVWTAIYQLVNAGFVPYVTYATSATVPAEFVISQSLPVGTVTGVPQVVTLIVSTGIAAPQGFTAVPSVIGLFARDATLSLQAAALSLDRYRWQTSSSPEGTVVLQSIPVTTVVAAGTIIQLTLSAGPARVAPTLTVPLVH